MYVFSQGGTMTESSNYDASRPCHRHTDLAEGRDQGVRGQYEFYVTKAPAAFDEITKGRCWSPSGRGVFVERITFPRTASRSPRRSSTISLILRASRPRVVVWPRGGV